MSNLRQAAQQALEALERGETKLRWAAITALRAALAEHDRLAGIEAIEKDAGIHVSQQSEPEQKPVAWMYSPLIGDGPKERRLTFVSPYEWGTQEGLEITPLYTAPTPRKPLTPEQLTKIELGLRVYADNDRYDLSLHDFARAIERKHGIGEQHE